MTRPDNPPLIDSWSDGVNLVAGAPISKITLRDLFAGMAMQGFYGKLDINAEELFYARDDAASVAAWAYMHADALLRERAKQ